MNRLYPKWKEALIAGSANSGLNGTVRAALIDRAAYSYSDTHAFYTSIAPAVVGAAQTLASPTYTNGIFGADPVLNFPAVSGPTVGAIVLHVWTGAAATSRLVAYIEDAPGLPIVPDGGDQTITWDAAGIFQL